MYSSTVILCCKRHTFNWTGLFFLLPIHISCRLYLWKAIQRIGKQKKTKNDFLQNFLWCKMKRKKNTLHRNRKQQISMHPLENKCNYCMVTFSTLIASFFQLSFSGFSMSTLSHLKYIFTFYFYFPVFWFFSIFLFDFFLLSFFFCCNFLYIHFFCPGFWFNVLFLLSVSTEWNKCTRI